MDETTKLRPAAVELDDLDTLEAESMFIIREVVAEFEHPVMLFSGGKDSVLMLQLARKAFAPAPMPFPILHVDTGHNFPEVIEFRDKVVEEYGLRLEVASVQDLIDDGIIKVGHELESRNRHQTRALLDAIKGGGFDAGFGGGRRATRRGQGPRQGAGAQLPRQIRPVGPEEPAARALAPLQRPPPQGRAHPRLPDLRLDRARRLALPRPGTDRAAADLLRPGAAAGRQRRPADGGQRVLPAARGRRVAHRDVPLPDGRRRDPDRRRLLAGDRLPS